MHSPRYAAKALVTISAWANSSVKGTSMSIKQSDPNFSRAYERATLRAAFVSLLWAVFTYRKRKDGLTLQALAKSIPANKAEVSRWFKGDPNWTVNTIASLANALNVDLRITAVDRKTGALFTP